VITVEEEVKSLAESAGEVAGETKEKSRVPDQAFMSRSALSVLVLAFVVCVGLFVYMIYRMSSSASS